MAIQIFDEKRNDPARRLASLERSGKVHTEVAGQCFVQAERWVIVGGGGFGREVYSWTMSELHSSGNGTPVGFLDENPDCFDDFPRLKSLWLGPVSSYVPQSGDRLLMAIADPRAKLAVGSSLLERGSVFASFVHPTVVISQDVKIGAGCVLCPFATVSCNVQISDFVSINVGSVIGHDSIIESGCTLSPNSNISGQVHLERGVFTGCQSVIFPKTRVGEFCRIGAGSVIVGHVRPNSTMMGSPAMHVKWSRNHGPAEENAA